MREQLLDRMIRLYGFEHPIVIDFAKAMERGISTESLRVMVECHEACPYAGEDE